MGRTVAIGEQNFEELQMNHYFYIDKTRFIKAWWESGSPVTVITRPRRFGKTLTLHMLECFFSIIYKDRGELFEGLSIWEDAAYKKLQGTYPVVSLTFADVKETTCERTVERILENISEVYRRYRRILPQEALPPDIRERFHRHCTKIAPEEGAYSIKLLSGILQEYYGKKVLIFLDEYDTPMLEAYVYGFWNELASFLRSLFNSTFKTNPYLQRAIMTGITIVGKEAMFSDFNNPSIASVTSNLYADAFGFTEPETYAALKEMGYGKEEQGAVKEWYDGFRIGDTEDIYNPWSIINFLSSGNIDLYWNHTSSNSLISHLLQNGDRTLKQQFEDLIIGNKIHAIINERIDFHQLEYDSNAVWSLLHAAGYLKAMSIGSLPEAGVEGRKASLAVTNRETRVMFRGLVRKWFAKAGSDYNDFAKALLNGNLEEMQAYFESVTRCVFSSFDSGIDVSERAPERFYHGFVLGLIVELRGRYEVKSNRESGLGRYDVMLIPMEQARDDAILIEFKVFNSKKEADLEQTASAALKQIEEKAYEQELIDRGIPKEHIRKYAFAFRGKEVLIRD